MFLTNPKRIFKRQPFRLRSVFGFVKYDKVVYSHKCCHRMFPFEFSTIVFPVSKMFAIKIYLNITIFICRFNLSGNVGTVKFRNVSLHFVYKTNLIQKNTSLSAVYCKHIYLFQTKPFKSRFSLKF